MKELKYCSIKRHWWYLVVLKIDILEEYCDRVGPLGTEKKHASLILTNYAVQSRFGGVLD